MISVIPQAGERAWHDWRLVPAAVAIWLAGLLGLAVSWWLALACGLVAAAVGAGLLVARSSRSRLRIGTAVPMIVAGGLIVVALSVPLHAAEHDPLRAEAARGASITAEVTLLDRSRPLRADVGGEAAVLTRARVDSAVVDDSALDSTGRITVIAPAEQWAGLLPGQQVTLAGQLAPSRGTELAVATVWIRGGAEPPAVRNPAAWWQRAGHEVRENLRAAAAVLPANEAGLMPGLVVGDTSEMPQQVIEDFRASGMAHLVAVSGLHVGIIVGAAVLVLRVLRAGPRTQALVGGAVLVAYMITVGYAPSVLRAGLMGGVGLLALFLGRRRSAMPALAFAVAALVVYDPEMAVRHGFAMSVAATAGLVVLAPAWVEALRRRGVPVGFAAALVIPLVAFLATAPIIAGMAGRVSLVTVAANLVATPVVALATVLGALTALLAGFAPWLAELTAQLAWPALGWLVLVARRSAHMPGAVLDWPDGWWGGALAALAAAGLAVAARLAYRRRLLLPVCAGLGLGAVLAVLVARMAAPAWPPEGWAVAACDVGQGDGFVLATGQPGEAVVVDTGNEFAGLPACLDRLGIDTIPLVAITHLHDDHFADLPAVLAGRDVGAVAVGPGRTPVRAWDEVRGAAEEHEVPLVEPAVGEQFDLPGLTLEVLGPRHVPVEQSAEPSGTEVNDLSLVLRAETALGTVLLTGDIEIAAQGDLLASGTGLDADVLTVPHHGSGATLPEFLDAVAPGVALISVGADNPYGHPDAEVVAHLTDSGATVARTDTAGDIALVPAGDATVVATRGE